MPHNAPLAPPDFRAVFSELTGLYLLLAPDLTILAASRAYLRATGQTERIIGRRMFDVFKDTEANAHEGQKALALSLQRVVAERVPNAMALQRYDLLLTDGTAEVRYWSPVNTPVLDATGGLVCIIHRVVDVTAAASAGQRDPRIAELESELVQSGRRLEAAYDDVRRSEARLRLALEAGGAAVWHFRLSDEFVRVTPDLNRLVGLPPDHPTILAELRDGFVDEPEPIRRAAMEAWQAGQRVLDHGFRYRRHDDGRFVWLNLRAEVICDEGGQPREVVGVLQDVTERITVQERQRTLINELNHRVKNNLALVQSLAVRTFRGRGCDPPLNEFIDRLIALAGTHELLTRREWTHADVAEVVGGSLRGLSVAGERLRLSGPDVHLGPDLAVSLALATHELATNAIKYGALSNSTGSVEVTWTVEPSAKQLRLTWRERGGPPVEPPRRQGFGTQLLSRIFGSVGGRATTTYNPAGVVCHLQAHLD
ncbi:MAG: sensor histidine kinase [Pseudomonadota bacterium]|jgi:PAS domain S-box-containing protein